MRAAVRRDEASPWGVAMSIALHAMLLAALMLSPAVRRVKRPREESVAVDILTPGQFQASVAPRPVPIVMPPPAGSRRPPAASMPAKPPSSAMPAPSSDAPAMIRPTRMLSAGTLADPRSRQARADLATFAGSERMAQLCNLEAMDQIRRWRADFQPDRVVAYATADEKIATATIIADGAAFRSKGRWFGLRFKCELAKDGETVTGFEFLVGDPVPEAKWDGLGLPAVH